MKIHKHTWKRDNILCDNTRCFEASPQLWHDYPFLLQLIMYSILCLVACIIGLITAYFFGKESFGIGFSLILILAWWSRYYGITRN